MIEQTEKNEESAGVGSGEGLSFTLEEVPTGRVSIKVVGIGGCGGNIVDHMIEAGLGGVDYICINTDDQALERCVSPVKLQIGKRVTQGYGTGSDPEVGREAALENTEELAELLGDADMVFLTTGLGGGTGTGAAPVVGSLAKQMGALTIAAAVKPFAFEGKRKAHVANEGFRALLEQVDTAVEIPNERLLAQIDPGSGFFESFRVANQIATETLQGITDIINRPGIMNSDFADIRAVLEDAGEAVVGSSQKGGPEAAVQAARQAISNLMMEPDTTPRASKILINVTGSAQFGMHDASEALSLIQREFDHDANLIIGAVRDESLEDKVRVMVVASGFHRESFELQPGAETEDTEDAPFGGDTAGWHTEVAAASFAEEPGDFEGTPAEEQPVPNSASPDEDPAPDGEAFPRDDRRSELELPTNGVPLEFVPPPPIRIAEADAQPPPPKKRGLFRRKSIFG